MARLFTRASSQALVSASSPFTTERAFSAVAKIRPANVANRQGVVFIGSGSSTSNHFVLGIESGGKALFFAREGSDTGGVQSSALSAATLTANVWTHLGCTWDAAGNMALFLAGTKSTQTTVNDNILNTSGQIVALGAFRDSSASDYFDGIIGFGFVWPGRVLADRIFANIAAGDDPRLYYPDELFGWTLTEPSGTAYDRFGHFDLSEVGGTIPLAGRGSYMAALPPPGFIEGATTSITSRSLQARAAVSDAWQAQTAAISPGIVAAMVEFDQSNNRIGIALDGGSMSYFTTTGTYNTQQNDFFAGIGLLDGAVASDANAARIGFLATFSAILSSDDKAVAWGAVADYLAPVVTPTSVALDSIEPATFDLTPYVKDPSGTGWAATSIIVQGTSTTASIPVPGTSTSILLAPTLNGSSDTITVRVTNKYGSPRSKDLAITVTVDLGTTVGDSGLMYDGLLVGNFSACDTPSWKWIGNFNGTYYEFASCFPCQIDHTPNRLRLHMRIRRKYATHVVNGSTRMKDSQGEYTKGDGGRPYAELRKLTSQGSSGTPDMTAGGLLYYTDPWVPYQNGYQSSGVYPDDNGVVDGWCALSEDEQYRTYTLKTNLSSISPDRTLKRGTRYALVIRNSVKDNARYSCLNANFTERPLKTPDQASGYVFGPGYDKWKSWRRNNEGSWYQANFYNAGDYQMPQFQIWDSATAFGMGSCSIGSSRQYQHLVDGAYQVQQRFQMPHGDNRTATGFWIRTFRVSTSSTVRNMTVTVYKVNNPGGSETYTELGSGIISGADVPRVNGTASYQPPMSAPGGVFVNDTNLNTPPWDFFFGSLTPKSPATKISLAAESTYTMRLSAPAGAGYYTGAVDNPKRNTQIGMNFNRDALAVGTMQRSTDSGASWSAGYVWGYSAGNGTTDLTGGLVTQPA